MARPQRASKRLAEKRKKSSSKKGPETKKAKIAPRKSSKKPIPKPTNVKNFDKPGDSDSDDIEISIQPQPQAAGPETKKANITPKKSSKKPSPKPTNVKNLDKPGDSDSDDIEISTQAEPQATGPETKKAKITPKKSSKKPSPKPTNVENLEKPGDSDSDDIEISIQPQLQAAEIRLKGNAFFGKFKNSPIKGQQKGFLTDAVQNYEEALKLVGNDEKDEKEKASICKNLAISLDYLTQLEERFLSTRLHLWQRALEYYVMAIHYGIFHGEKWLEGLCDKFEICYTNLDSDEKTTTIVLQILYNAGKMNHSKKFGKIARGILMDYGDGILTRALEAISDKKYKIGVPLLHEL